jgi:acetolactate synthase-1/2/3 large subunit
MLLSGAEIIVHCLEQLGVKYVFGQCGHSVPAFLAALEKSKIEFISFRHEQQAAHAADGYFKVTHKPGIVLTHVGPGLTNAITGAAHAALSSSAQIIITGDVQSYNFGKNPHQEINLYSDASQWEIYKPFTKRTWRIHDNRFLSRILSKAFNIALSGRPGVVLIDVPLDLSLQKVDIEIPELSKWMVTGRRPVGDLDDISKAVDLLVSAKRPFIYAGGGVLLSDASPELTQIAEYLGIPVGTTLSGKGAIDETHPLAVGSTGFWGTSSANEIALQSDLILGIGTRFSEFDTGLWDPSRVFAIPPAKLIHIDIDPQEIGRNYPVECGITGDAKAILGQVMQMIRERMKKVEYKNLERFKEVRRSVDKWRENISKLQNSDDVPIRLERVFKEVREIVPKDGIIVSDVGGCKYGVAHIPFYNPRTSIPSSGFATMGFAPAAAIGVKVGQPEKTVVVIAGDGAFSSVSSVLATAVEHSVNVVWVVLNNYGYCSNTEIITELFKTSFGTLHQTKKNGEPYNPDFAKMAESYGAKGECVRRPEEIRGALERAIKSQSPYVLDVIIGFEGSFSQNQGKVTEILTRK